MKVVLIFAHPDDETFSLGGTIIKLTDSGHIVKLITATKGEAGLPGTPAITTMNKLPEVRERELRNAAKILGIEQIYFLGEIDGTLEKVPVENLIKKISPILETELPDVVITFDPTGATNHPDHKAIEKAATKAFLAYMEKARKHVRLYQTAIPKSSLEEIAKIGLEYEDFGKMQGTPDEMITLKIDVQKVFPRKIEAMKMHETQNKDWERILKLQNLPSAKYEYLCLVSENEI